MTRVAGTVAIAIAVAIGFMACGETGSHRLSVPLLTVGTAPAPFAAGDWTVTLDDARVGIGPIYFCASKTSSADVCPASVAELTGSVELDALEPKREHVGDLDALSVEVRSAAWDFAITWPRTKAAPVVLDGAPDGHSAHFEGRAEKGDQRVQFAADIDLAPLLQGTREVQGIPTRVALAAGVACELHLNAANWWSQVDFDDLAERAPKDADVIEVLPGSRAYDALTVAMTSSAPPTIKWSE